LNLKIKEIKSLTKQIGELRAVNELYRKTVSFTTTRTLVPLDYLLHREMCKVYLITNAADLSKL
jgi:hypothetical protein